ncbi:hypothetical protein KL953_04125 [Mycolicibacterium goodii]|uniref:hypothetical protein n=1 Tax=Mycolicibacterium goodii TaxID=134601 RepID=UPI001BDBDDA5|nr:hypothetical protein [Mycolicibacterium goodii]MBU8808071.1 hypothetical protein [Mycolicibacterium goodii]
MKLSKPRGLGYQGTKLWDAITAEYDLELEPDKIRILEDACRTADWIQKLDAEAKNAPLTVKGSMRQPVINPLLAQVQTERERLSRFLSRLNFAPMED